MTNWFQTHTISPIYGWGPSKRWIVLGGPAMGEGKCQCQGEGECQGQGEGECQGKCQCQGVGEMVEEARKARCVYIEIRCFDDYSPYRNELEAAGLVYEPHYDVLFDLKDDPYLHMKPSKQQQLRRAKEEGETYRATTREEDIHNWYLVLRHLYCTKVHRPLPKERWFQAMIWDKGCTLLVVENKDQQIIGGALLAVEEDRSKAYEWYKCGHVMATWAALDWCRHHDIRVFDAMGAGQPGVPYSVRDFKLEMGGQLVEYGRYRLVLRPWLYRVGCWVIEDLRFEI